MALSSDRTRLAQVVLLTLLGVCVAQTLYWTLDQVAVANEELDSRRTYFEADARAANLLLAEGGDPLAIRQLFPHLEGPLADGPGTVVVAPSVLTQLEERRHRRILRLGSEGTFFLLVLLAGMGILLRAVARSAELARRQQNFLAAVTHELKSPLAALRLSLETLDLRDPEPARRAELIERALEDVDRLEAMVTNILDVGRIEEARAEHRVERVGIDAVVHMEVEHLARRARDRGVALEAGELAGLEVRADAAGLRSVVRNLLDNAVKASGGASGGTVRASTRTVGGRIALEVSDDGVGFPPGEAERIFEKFHRVGDELRRRDRGTGLGLYLARQLVERDGGSLVGRSEGEGRGAVFTATWPRAGGVA